MSNTNKWIRKVKGLTIKKMVAFIRILPSKIIKAHKINRIKKRLGDIKQGSYIDLPVDFYGNPKHVFIGEDTVIYGHFKIISVKGNFYVGNHTMAAQGLTVVTDNHVRNVGVLIKDMSDIDKYTRHKDVIIEDDVWLGSNVTLLPGVTIGRGAFIGAGAVIRKSVLPYAVVIGNPEIMIGFNMTPAEIIEHEKLFYSDQDRIPLDILEKNYSKSPQKILCRRKH